MGNAGAMKYSKKIDIIGMDVIDQPLSLQKRQCILDADILIGGTRLLESILFYKGEKLTITRNIQSIIDNIKQRLEKNQHIVVLATGDPLLFGIGKTLVHHFGIDSINIHPGISAVQVALSRLGLNTSKTIILSRHGAHKEDLSKVLCHEISVILTSNSHSPIEIINELIEEYPQTKHWKAYVCQCLGSINEKIQSNNLKYLSMEKKFKTPNLLIVENPEDLFFQPSFNFGKPDDMFEHESGLITHPEVRAITLSKLSLDNVKNLWDIGAGSGSVGIEAALLNPYLKVFSIEKNDGRYEQIIANKKKYTSNNVITCKGNALEICLSLTRPERIFIGGGGEQLSDLLTICYKRLLNGGIMIVNTVTIESFDIVRQFSKKIQNEIDCISVQISRLKKLSAYHAFKPDNTIKIFGIKK